MCIAQSHPTVNGRDERQAAIDRGHALKIAVNKGCMPHIGIHPLKNQSALYIKVTICARVQVASGLNVVALVPEVMFFMAHHWTLSK